MDAGKPCWVAFPCNIKLIRTSVDELDRGVICMVNKSHPHSAAKGKAIRTGLQISNGLSITVYDFIAI